MNITNKNDHITISADLLVALNTRELRTITKIMRKAGDRQRSGLTPEVIFDKGVRK